MHVEATPERRDWRLSQPNRAQPTDSQPSRAQPTHRADLRWARSVSLAPSRSNRRAGSAGATCALANRAGLSRLIKWLEQHTAGLVSAGATGASFNRAGQGRLPKLLCEERSVSLVSVGATADPHSSRAPFGWAEKGARSERDDDAMYRWRREAMAASEDRKLSGSASPIQPKSSPSTVSSGASSEPATPSQKVAPETSSVAPRPASDGNLQVERNSRTCTLPPMAHRILEIAECTCGAVLAA